MKRLDEYQIELVVGPNGKPGILRDSLVNGPGVNLVVFTQGCDLRCHGCHNQKSHTPGKGLTIPAPQIFDYVTPLTTGITFSGGEPLMQRYAIAAIAKEAKERGLQTMLFTGYELPDMPSYVLDHLDYVKCGRYKAPLRALNLPYRGSTNQMLYKVVNAVPTVWEPNQRG